MGGLNTNVTIPLLQRRCVKLSSWYHYYITFHSDGNSLDVLCRGLHKGINTRHLGKSGKLNPIYIICFFPPILFFKLSHIWANHHSVGCEMEGYCCLLSTLVKCESSRLFKTNRPFYINSILRIANMAACQSVKPVLSGTSKYSDGQSSFTWRLVGVWSWGNGFGHQPQPLCSGILGVGMCVVHSIKPLFDTLTYSG